MRDSPDLACTPSTGCNGNPNRSSSSFADNDLEATFARWADGIHMNAECLQDLCIVEHRYKGLGAGPEHALIFTSALEKANPPS